SSGGRLLCRRPVRPRLGIAISRNDERMRVVPIDHRDAQARPNRPPAKESTSTRPCYRSKGSPNEATPLSLSRRRFEEMMPSTMTVTR
ncbi:MAG: hypothetical protein E5W93_18885, partial [Mesorhizobium sp.]